MQINGQTEKQKVVLNEGSVCAANTRQKPAGLFNRQLVTVPGRHNFQTIRKNDTQNLTYGHIYRCVDCGYAYEVINYA